MRSRSFFLFFAVCAIAVVVIPAVAFAARPKYAVWVPYWQKTTAVPDVLAHIDVVDEISPFSYEVMKDGNVMDKLGITEEPWQGMTKEAIRTKTKVIPTVSWMNTDAIHATLASTTARRAHVNQIVMLVNNNQFDGIDIDYENKKAETRPYFSQFLKDLSAKLHTTGKKLSCSVESRTPLTSRFVKIPQGIEYANDLAAIGRACDHVRILAYDQSNIDIKLNKKKGTLGYYAPVADTEWVSKVIGETLRYMSPSKVMLGIPTFGYEYEVSGTTTPYTYRRMRSVSYKDAIATATSTGATPLRNSAGELSFTYSKATTTRLVWFNDATSIASKIALVRKYKLRGAALFKIDGEGDINTWSKLK